MSVRRIVDCSSWILSGAAKDGTYLATEFAAVWKEIDPEGIYVDFCILDGASVCKLAQKILEITHPRVSFITGADHVGHNIFKYWSKLGPIAHLIKQDRVSRLC